jgi:hypothetical protein
VGWRGSAVAVLVFDRKDTPIEFVLNQWTQWAASHSTSLAPVQDRPVEGRAMNSVLSRPMVQLHKGVVQRVADGPNRWGDPARANCLVNAIPAYAAGVRVEHQIGRGEPGVMAPAGERRIGPTRRSRAVLFRRRDLAQSAADRVSLAPRSLTQ